MNLKYFVVGLLFFSLLSCQNQDPMESRQVGVIAAFSEVVGAGVKKLALSEPMSPEEMDQFLPKAKEAADKYGVSIFRESDLLITDLFPTDVATGKDVLLLYQGNTLDAYQQIKEDKAALEAAGKYNGSAREAIARRFGRLLSYSPQGINRLLASNTAFKTMYDFDIEASNVFLYYKDLKAATEFYQQILGLELIADYQMAVTFRISADSYLILVDAEKGMHTADEPKTVALAFLTNQLKEWWDYLNEQNVEVKYPYKSKEGSAHDGFVMIDPEGYLLEFETFKQHPENEDFIPILDKNETIYPQEGKSLVPAGLGFNSSITWLYYKDLLEMQNFYEQVLGLPLVADQSWTKIYQVSQTGFIGLVDERRGMHDFTEDKAVTVSFFLKDLKGWYDYVQAQKPFELRTGEWEIGPEERYNAFVGYDPEGYFIEFDRFLEHPDNVQILKYLQ